jgi:hypothetical protein
MFWKQRIDEKARLVSFEKNLDDNSENLYNVITHKPYYKMKCTINARGRSACNDGRCMYTHDAERATLLCVHEAKRMNQSKVDQNPYDRDRVLAATFKCPDDNCPLNHFCHVCSYAPSCSCEMIHEHQFNTTNGYIGSVINQNFHNYRLSVQCCRRFETAIDMIINAAQNIKSPFCSYTTMLLQQQSHLITGSAGRQPNEKLGLIWQVAGVAFNTCPGCSNILDSIVCGYSPDTCPNNNVSICAFMNGFKLNKGAPSLRPNPSNSTFDLIVDSDDSDDSDDDSDDDTELGIVNDTQFGIVELFDRHWSRKLCGLCPKNFLGQCFDCNYDHLIDDGMFNFEPETIALHARHAAVYGGPSMATLVRRVFSDMQTDN